jgi:hypothetical protein
MGKNINNFEISRNASAEGPGALFRKRGISLTNYSYDLILTLSIKLYLRKISISYMENIELSEIKEAGLSHLLFQTYFLPVVIFGYPVLKFLAFLVKAIFKLLMPMPDLKNRYCG